MVIPSGPSTWRPYATTLHNPYLIMYFFTKEKGIRPIKKKKERKKKEERPKRRRKKKRERNKGKFLCHHWWKRKVYKIKCKSYQTEKFIIELIRWL